MVLSCDIGNSYIKFAVFGDNDEVLYGFSVATSVKRSSDEYRLLIKQFLNSAPVDFEITDAVISSVVPSVTSAISKALSDYTARPFIIGSGTHTGFKIKIYESSELGADIVSNVAATRDAAGYPAIVVDMGTATTLTAVDTNGDITGTIIHPGLGVCSHALTESAAKLSDVMISQPEKLIGQNSNESIKSGLIFGHACMIDGLISKMESEICTDNCDIKLIATGEFAPYVAPFCERKMEIKPDLTLRGNVLLYRLNRKKRP